MSKTINLEINDENLNYDYKYITSGCTIGGVQYYSLVQYCTMNSKYIGTVRNWMKKIPKANSRDFYVSVDGKIFVTDSIGLLENPDFNLKKIPNGDLIPLLSKYSWDYYGTVRFTHNYTVKTVAEKMKNISSFILKRYKNIEVRMFYATEKNKDGMGYHGHFLLWSNRPLKYDIKCCAENYLRARKDIEVANTKIESYVVNGGAVQYILKETAINKDGYDFLWNRSDVEKI